jgi:hypothetical protein
MKALDRPTGARAQVHDLFDLEETSFDEAPARLCRYYRHWGGHADTLGPNEILCPVCHVVLRSTRALRVGDELHCLPCLTSLQLVEQGGLLVAVAKLP